MKLLSIIILSGIVFLFASRVSAETKWNIEKSTHFIIYYQEAPSEYIRQVSGKAEQYYQSITDYLGFRRFNFWTWDNRCKIYLYISKEEYLNESSSASWSEGGAQVATKEIISYYIGGEKFFERILPHEMGHIIFREFVGIKKKVPLWLDEAIAVLQEKDRENYLVAAKKLVKEGDYIPLDVLSRISNYTSIVPITFYSESAGIIEFLLREFGSSEFVTFCRRLRDGEEWEEALLRTYRFKDLNALEKAWVDNQK